MLRQSGRVYAGTRSKAIFSRYTLSADKKFTSTPVHKADVDENQGEAVPYNAR